MIRFIFAFDMPYKDPAKRKAYHADRAAKQASENPEQIKQRKAAWFQKKKAVLRVRARLKYQARKATTAKPFEVVDALVFVSPAKAREGLTHKDLMDMLVALEAAKPQAAPSAGK